MTALSEPYSEQELGIRVMGIPITSAAIIVAVLTAGTLILIMRK